MNLSPTLTLMATFAAAAMKDIRTLDQREVRQAQAARAWEHARMMLTTMPDDLKQQLHREEQNWAYHCGYTIVNFPQSS